jgi:WD40 repeat protein
MITIISSPLSTTSNPASLRDLTTNTLIKTVLDRSLGESLSQMVPDKVPGDVIELLRQALIQRYRLLLRNITNSYSPTVLIGHTQELKSVAFSPDGKYVLTSSKDHTARLWDIQDKDNIKSCILKHQTEPILAAAFSPDGNFALTGSVDGTARLWDLAFIESLTLPMILLIIKLDQNAQYNNQILTQKDYSQTFDACNYQLKKAIMTYFKLEPTTASSSNSN